VKLEHLLAFLWLRWRLLLNQLRKGGTANIIALTILAVLVGIAALGGVIAFFLIGCFLLPTAVPLSVLFTWDGLILFFLFFWATGLLTELQRAETLSLDKFLHLPVSLFGVFLVNYLSSLLSINLCVFVPAMLALALGQAFGQGPRMLLLLPLLAAFVLALTALTYQLQGWLASLMTNKRRRRTIIVVVTLVFILFVQLPNLLNFMQPWHSRQRHAIDQQEQQEGQELLRAWEAGKLTQAELREQQQKLREKYQAEAEQRQHELEHSLQEIAWYSNLAIPFGWLPLGAMELAGGQVLPALLGTLGLILIGSASLWRAYRTTVRLYTGHYTSGQRAVPGAPAAAAVPAGPPPQGFLLEWHLPGVSEQAQVIALGGLRSLLRAPEVKMILLGPIVMMFIFGGMILSRDLDMPLLVRPLLAFGATAMVLFTQMQLIANQFGFDRSGFRVFVLCCAPRREILLGKNLALAPLTLGLALAAVLVLEAVYPMRLDHFVAVLPQMVVMYLLCCLLANLASILAPLPIAAGSMRPANPRVMPMLVQGFLGLLLPLLLAPTLLPLGVEALLQELGWVQGMPIYLVLSLLQCGVVVLLYRWLLTYQGQLLQLREQKILEMVTTRAG
jgi:hypothetical protein